MEGLGTQYIEKLSTTDKPAVTLVSFFSNLLGVSIQKSYYPMMHKLLKLYDRYTIFYAIIDIYNMDKPSINNYPYGIINYFCKKRLEKTTKVHEDARALDLSKTLKEIDKEIKATRKAKLELPERYDE